MYISTAMVCAGIVEAKTKQRGYFYNFLANGRYKGTFFLEIDADLCRFEVIYILVDF